MLTTKNIRNRKITAFLIICMVLCSLVVLTPKQAMADNGSGSADTIDTVYKTCKKDCDNNSSLCGTAFWLATTATNCNPEFQVINLAVDFLKIGDSGDTAKLWNGMGDIYDAIRVIGITLMVLYLFLSIVEKVSADSITVEQVIRKLIGFTICLIIVLNGKLIINAIKDFANALLDDTTNYFVNGFDTDGKIETMYELKTKLTDSTGAIAKTIAAISVMLEYLLPFVAQFVFAALCIVGGISRLIELCVRYMYAPIGMAPLVVDGMRGPGARYLKKIAACLINGAVMAAVVYLSTSLSTLFTGFLGTLAMTAFPLAGIAFILKTQSIADDIVGVH